MSWFEILFYVLMVANIAFRIYSKRKKKKAKKADSDNSQPITEVEYEEKK